MQTGRARQPDPIAWCTAIALAFLVIAIHRLGLPSKLYFDEIHYVPAARKLLAGIAANREHPAFAKQVLAASIRVLGDGPLAWRLPALLFGTFGLFAFGRLLWQASASRFATLAGMALLATNFSWFIQSRIAMLDIVAASLAIGALWQFATALDKARPRARLHLGLCGVLIGLALGSKWSVAPVALAMGVAWLFLRRRRRGAGRPAIALGEAACWLGLLPLLVYWATFAPELFLANGSFPASPSGFIDRHREMIALLDSTIKPHPYRSAWYEWVINWRPVWYLYEPVDGAQRGIVQLGNPFTMLAGLPALAWCLWTGVARGRRDALAFALLWCACLALWPLSGKPVQFYYHYLLSGAWLMACLAIALADMVRSDGKWRGAALVTLPLALAMFVHFYPIISAAELHEGRSAFREWMWLDSWR